MSTKKFSLRLKEIRFKKVYVYYFLYLFAITSVIIQIVYKYENLYPFTMIFLGAALILS